MGEEDHDEETVKLLSYAIFIVGYYLLRAFFSLPQNGRFYISFLNVGQGDAFVISIPSYGRALIDAGADYQSNYLSARTSILPVCNIKSIFITHYDNDHVGGLERISKFCRNVAVYDNLSYGDVVDFGVAKLYVLSPLKKNSTHQENNDSLVMLLKYHDFEALLTGDAGLDVLEPVGKIIKEYKSNGTISGDLDVYKASHHGSLHNSSKNLVEELKPVHCLISVGENNYGHPSKDVIKDLTRAGCRVQRTDTDGTTTFYGIF